MIYPQNLEQKIGFNEVRTLLKEKCMSSLGEEFIDKMSFSTQYDTITRWLDEVCEFIRIEQEEDNFPAQFFFDLRTSLKRIRIEGMYLDEQELFDLLRSLETVQGITRFLTLNEEEEEQREEGSPRYPNLKALAGDIIVYPQLTRRIHQILGPYGKVKDNASRALANIRRELASTSGNISRSLNSILRQAQADGLVEKEASPTMRDGRLVIPVAPALKRKIKGIVHDESASGKTVFIEPTAVVEANNRIRELEGEERREIIRIFTEFTAEVRPHIDQLLYSYTFLAHIDFIRAKALLALQMKAIKPSMEDKQLIDWDEAVHPLLKASLERNDKKVVPLDIKLHEKQRILIISGPNAGGKSVCLKTVGLLQYMLQCGLLITLHERSHAGIFESIFIDIGDEQSIEDDLSTYSSHLTNMKMMVKHTDEKSLILIDEFGGGTEPQIGGAIAEALLKRFNARQTYGVITTHYQNLKHFADEHEAIVNAAMLYDRHEMRALFQLQIGNPGSSFAVEIARKIGLPEEVIQDASNLVGSEYINADKYLQDIVRDKRYWESKRQNIRLQDKKMKNSIERYEQKLEELEKSSKSILRNAKEEAENLLRNSNAQIERTIRTIKEAEAEKEKTKEARQDLAHFRDTVQKADEQLLDESILRKMKQLKAKQERKKQRKEEKKNTEKSPQENTPKAQPSKPILKVGSAVKLKGQTAVGTIESIQGKNATVIFGQMKTNVKINRLQATLMKDTVNTESKIINVQTQNQVTDKRLKFKQEIDVRGMRGDEAIQAVTYFIDDAILLSVGRVRILHGTGTGILRKLIRNYLSTVGGVQAYKDEHVQFGGAGITVVDLV